MDKLWSPWRSNYIQSFKHKSDNEECVFCSLHQLDINDVESLVVYKSDLCFVMLNLYPYNSGHLMIIPYRHISDIEEITKDEFAEITGLITLSKKALTDLMKPQGFNIGANIGKAAGAGIDQHIHFHILPRWIGDTNFMPAIGEVKVISQDLLETKKELVKVFNRITGD
ncbi:hit family protein [hydrocarbon metagenome]|uniref:Hit family protein n=1 Tax=hydrocarbon metagenome TaxID=938273 RepID=A0A0W8FUW7_9ZZZZ